jgi:hypothetical protein
MTCRAPPVKYLSLPSVEAGMKRIARGMVSSGQDRTVRYQPHPDPRQEQLFFALLRECLEQGSITNQFLRESMRKNYLRKDAFAILSGRPGSSS